MYLGQFQPTELTANHPPHNGEQLGHEFWMERMGLLKVFERLGGVL
jgi:hypothetical protein